MLTYQQAKDIEDALGPQQAGPLLAVLQDLDRKIENQKQAVKADLLLELATKADLADLRTEIVDLRQANKADIAGLEGSLKTDLARLEGKIETEIARLDGRITGLDGRITGLDGKIETEIARLEGKITGLDGRITGLDGKIETEIAKIHGELKSIRLWMKLLVIIGILGMTFFSPTTVKLLEMLK